MHKIIYGFLAGAYIAFGANLAVKIGSMPGASTAGGQVLFGSVFCLGLILVVIAGADLFTGCCYKYTDLLLAHEMGLSSYIGDLIIMFFANYCGALVIMLLINLGGFWFAHNALTPMGIKALLIGQSKLQLSWSQAFVRGILCNWLVCLAVYMAMQAKSVGGKILAIFFPIMGFVASGFEHCIANMFFIPSAIMIAHAYPVQTMKALHVTDLHTLTYSYFHIHNLIPVTLGNIVGGAFFVAILYWLGSKKLSA